MKERLIIAYGKSGEKNITLNKGENHIILSKEESAFLIASLLNNTKIEKIELY